MDPAESRPVLLEPPEGGITAGQGPASVAEVDRRAPAVVGTPRAGDRRPRAGPALLHLDDGLLAGTGGDLLDLLFHQRASTLLGGPLGGGGAIALAGNEREAGLSGLPQSEPH